MTSQASPASELRPFVLFVPLLSGGPGPSPWPSPVQRERGREVPTHAGRAVDLRSTYVAVSLVTGFGPFPCPSVLPELPVLRPGPTAMPSSRRGDEALLPIGDRGKAAPGAVAVPRGDRGPTSPTIRAAYPVPTRGHC